MSAEMMIMTPSAAAFEALQQKVAELEKQLRFLQATEKGRWLKPTEAAEVMGLSSKTLLAIARRGEVVYKAHGRRFLYDKYSLYEYNDTRAGTKGCRQSRLKQDVLIARINKAVGNNEDA